MDIIVLEGVIIPWTFPRVNDGFFVYFPESRRAVAVFMDQWHYLANQGQAAVSTYMHSSRNKFCTV